MTIQILVRSKESTEFGLPNKMGVYEIGEVRQIGQYFNVAVLVLREDGLHIPPVHLQAGSAEAARKLVIQHYRKLAKEMKLDIVVTKRPSAPN